MSLSSQSNFASFQKQAYDNVSIIYDQAMVSHHDYGRTILSRISSTLLKPNSKILDIGCGTGKPVAEYFANEGHDVTGIDFSSKMIEIARRHVPNATFIQADMTAWEPSDSSSYDLIIVCNAFFILSVAQIRSMIYKIADWVKKDGLVVIGTCHNQAKLDKLGVQFDHRGWADDYSNIFLGQDTGDGSQGREEAWANLIKEAGLEILGIQRALCQRGNDPDPDTQIFITARRVKDNHLIGPFPIPDTFSGPVTMIDLDAWTKLTEKVELDEVKQTALEALRKEPSCRKVIYVDKPSPAFQFRDVFGIEIQHTSLLSFLDVQPGSADGVLFSWILNVVPSPGNYLDYALKTIPPGGNARLVVIQAAPDNELLNLINSSIQDLNLPIQHHGYLLQEAEAKLRAAGFQTMRYIRTQGSVNFGSVEAGERVATAARVLSRIWAVDEAVQAQIEGRLKKLLKLRFIFKTSGRILDQTVVLVAERS